MVVVLLINKVPEFLIMKLWKKFCELCDEIYSCILFNKMHDRPFDNGKGVFKLQIVFIC